MITDFENNPGFTMSDCIVGNMTAPPKQNRIVPNDRKKDL